MNNLTSKQLYDLWEGVSRVSGWVGIIGRNKLLPENVLLEFEKIDDEVIKISEDEKYYYNKILPEVKKSEMEFVEEITREEPDWVKGRRLEFLRNELAVLEKNNNDLLKIIKKITNENEKWFIGLIDERIEENNKKIKRIKFEINAYEKVELNDKNGITDEDIEMARDVDCSQFINIVRKENGRSWACCPFHQEKKPSFVCYGEGKGFYCFGCNAGGDAIELVMKLYNYSFIETVKFLNENL